jgi:UDP-N-acetylglucosamine acyltransferase
MARIHPTAIVDGRARLADDVEVGPFSVIGPDVAVGPATRLLNNVTVLNRTTLGAHNVVYPFAVVGGKPQDLKYRGEDTSCVIGDHNTIREFVTINIGTAGGGGVTKIGSHCLLMAGCHIAHDCDLGDHIVIANNVLLAGHVRVEDWVAMSAYVGLHHFLTVGRHAFIGGYTRANVDIPPFMIVNGIPMEVVAPNAVGLKRRGFNDDQLRVLKDAHRLLWRSGLPKGEAMQIVEQRYPAHPDVRVLLEALRATDGGSKGRARDPGRGTLLEGDEDADG